MTTVDIYSLQTDGPVDWRDDALCRGQLSLFFPRKAERPEAHARREAKAQRLCNECVVQATCRTFARAHREYGFWAGESEEDRHILGYTVAAPIGVRARMSKDETRVAS